MADITDTTVTLSITVERGSLLISDSAGNRAYTVNVTQGDIRGRGLLWAERHDGITRVLPSADYKAFIG